MLGGYGLFTILSAILARYRGMMVIRYKETFCGMENWCYGVWKLSDNPALTKKNSQGGTFQRKIKQVTKQEAMRIVKEEGLVVALRCNDGVVWDTPDKAYYNKWKGFFSLKREKEI